MGKRQQTRAVTFALLAIVSAASCAALPWLFDVRPGLRQVFGTLHTDEALAAGQAPETGRASDRSRLSAREIRRLQFASRSPFAAPSDPEGSSVRLNAIVLDANSPTGITQPVSEPAANAVPAPTASDPVVPDRGDQTPEKRLTPAPAAAVPAAGDASGPVAARPEEQPSGTSAARPEPERPVPATPPRLADRSPHDEDLPVQPTAPAEVAPPAPDVEVSRQAAEFDGEVDTAGRKAKSPAEHPRQRGAASKGRRVESPSSDGGGWFSSRGLWRRDNSLGWPE